MQMVGHQAICPDIQRSIFHSSFSVKTGMWFCLHRQKDTGAVIAPLGDMMGILGRYNAGNSWHMPSLYAKSK
jgi:hypothetical protein